MAQEAESCKNRWFFNNSAKSMRFARDILEKCLRTGLRNHDILGPTSVVVVVVFVVGVVVVVVVFVVVIFVVVLVLVVIVVGIVVAAARRSGEEEEEERGEEEEEERGGAKRILENEGSSKTWVLTASRISGCSNSASRCARKSS